MHFLARSKHPLRVIVFKGTEIETFRKRSEIPGNICKVALAHLLNRQTKYEINSGLMLKMTTLNVASVALRTYGGEPMAHGQNISMPRSSLTTPEGSCPLTSHRPQNPKPEQHTVYGTGIPLQGDCVRGFESEKCHNTNFRNPKWGDRLEILGLRFRFSKRHKTPTQLEPLRQVGDPLADECVAALGIKPGADALEILEQYLSRPICEQEAQAPRNFQDSVLEVPDWVDWNIIRQGQQTYWTHVSAINFVLLHYCLVGGFGAPRLARTLRCTNYLTSSLDRSYQRLMETSQMVYDCMDGGIQSLQPRTGKGWSSVVRVRFLHTQVRLRILSLAQTRPDYYSVEENGVPINQEDLVATLCAFSIAVIAALEKIGIYLSPKEVSAYLHLWRLVGHYMGVLPENNPLTSHRDAFASMESILSHISYPDDQSANLANFIIRAVAEKPPLMQSFAFHSACSRFLLGEESSNALQIQSSSLYDRIVVGLFFATLSLPPNSLSTQIARTLDKLFRTELAATMEMSFTMKALPRLTKEDLHV